jgi:XTP/dITP diphosphohydrolase
MDKKLRSFARLLKIMDELRENCPWDRDQTLESLRHLTIEETYELSDAILKNDLQSLKGELGDLMLHIVFYAKIASESGVFGMADVLDNICDKLVVRHPHIYGDVKVKDQEEVKSNWEKLKLRNGKKSVLDGVSLSLPPLMKAYRMQEKAGGVGFEWEKREDVWKKVVEEMAELQNEVESNAPLSKLENEFGDLIFALVNYARYIGVNPDDALERTNLKFFNRFTFIEEKARSEGRSVSTMTLEEMDNYWNQAKSGER